MKDSVTVNRHHLWLVVAIAVLAAGSILLYRVLPIAGIALGVGSGTVAIVVLAHLGVLAAIIASLMASRRRSRARKT
jgi:hypothetical protein